MSVSRSTPVELESSPDMIGPKGIHRAQSLTHKLQRALTQVRSVSSEREENLASHIGLLPSALQEQIIEDRTRRPRAPSPEETHPKKLFDPQSSTRQVSLPSRYSCVAVSPNIKKEPPENEESLGKDL
ncbi:hypothetical protein N7486_011099 [Penicillium sp. IBT 16267x]|nr:hypothetical protein N7486_011099 [Penicillium sp. IBT 16267x]